MAEVDSDKDDDRFVTWSLAKNADRAAWSTNPRLTDACRCWSVGLSCATLGVSQSFSTLGRNDWVRSSVSATSQGDRRRAGSA